MPGTSGEADLALKRMRLRYAGTCRSCGEALAAGTTAVFERATKTVVCLDCLAPAGAPSAEAPSAVIVVAPPVADAALGAPAGARQSRHTTVLVARSNTAVVPAASASPHDRHVPAYRSRIRLSAKSASPLVPGIG